MKQALGIGLLVLVATAQPSHAQSETVSYLRSVIKPGQVVFVTGPDGTEMKGVLLSISDQGLEVTMAGSTVPYRFGELRLIEVPDPIINGVLVGGLIGALGGSMPAWDADRPRSTAAIWTAAGCGLGALLGGYFDHLREGRKRIFRGGTIASIAPDIRPRTLAVSASIRW